MEAKDLTLDAGEGLVNIRVCAIIIRDGKLLMTGDSASDYLYSVGGRVHFGETTEQAMLREVWEETGVHMQIDRLGFVAENFFRVGTEGKLMYELAFYYYMVVPEDFTPASMAFTDGQARHWLEWIAPDTEKTIYPAFFRDAVWQQQPGIQHIVVDER